MKAIDTNVLVRLFTRDDPKQVAAAEAFVAPGAWISHVVLVEAVWVLTSVYRRSARDIATAIEMLLQHQSLAVQDSDIVSAALKHYRKTPRAGFSDCLVLEIARSAGRLPLGTFDRPLSRFDGARKL